MIWLNVLYFTHLTLGNTFNHNDVNYVGNKEPFCCKTEGFSNVFIVRRCITWETAFMHVFSF